MTNCSQCKKNKLENLESKFGIMYDSPIFSFKYLVNNKKYNFEAIPDNELKDFCKKLIEKISKFEKEYTIRSLFNLRKDNVFEKVTIENLYFKPSNIKYSNESVVFVFRITSDYRMICMFSDVAPIFHVIGFDFRFNAYNHGS